MGIWVWLALALAFAAIEVATVGLTSIWFAAGALAGLLSCAIGLPAALQLLAFAAVSALLLYFTRPWALRYLKPRLTRTNYEQALGEEVTVKERVDNRAGTGTVLYRGQEWTGRSFDGGRTFEPGEVARVREIRGVTMYIEGPPCGMPGSAAQQGWQMDANHLQTGNPMAK